MRRKVTGSQTIASKAKEARMSRLLSFHLLALPLRLLIELEPNIFVRDDSSTNKHSRILRPSNPLEACRRFTHINFSFRVRVNANSTWNCEMIRHKLQNSLSKIKFSFLCSKRGVTLKVRSRCCCRWKFIYKKDCWNLLIQEWFLKLQLLIIKHSNNIRSFW